MEEAEKRLLTSLPELRTLEDVYWRADEMGCMRSVGPGQHFPALCSLLKRNAIPVKILRFSCIFVVFQKKNRRIMLMEVIEQG